MRFSPQRRAIFRHPNFKKWPNHDSFLTFSLPNVLFATAACNFSTSELQKVVQPWQFFNIFTSKCAFRHSRVQFLISPLSSDLRARRFNRPTFRLTRHTDHWKNTAFREFSNIYRGCIFFLLTFALVYLLPSDLTAFLIYFSTVHIVGSLLFKLPSTTTNTTTMTTTTQKQEPSQKTWLPPPFAKNMGCRQKRPPGGGPRQPSQKTWVTVAKNTTDAENTPYRCKKHGQPLQKTYPPTRTVAKNTCHRCKNTSHENRRKKHEN